MVADASLALRHSRSSLPSGGRVRVNVYHSSRRFKFMTRTIGVWVVVFLLALVSCSGCGKPAAGTKQFVSPDGTFTVQMPGTPKQETQSQGRLTMKLYTLETPKGAYA